MATTEKLTHTREAADIRPTSNSGLRHLLDYVICWSASALSDSRLLLHGNLKLFSLYHLSHSSSVCGSSYRLVSGTHNIDMETIAHMMPKIKPGAQTASSAWKDCRVNFKRGELYKTKSKT